MAVLLALLVVLAALSIVGGFLVHPLIFAAAVICIVFFLGLGAHRWP